ncbi:MAG: pseudouridine synthase [Oscillospiraceae bacterium]
MTERLDKIISSQSNCSRKDARIIIKRGRVRVNKKVVLSPETKLDARFCEIVLDNDEVVYKKHVYIMLNKPKGILSAASDKTRKTVIDLLSDELKGRALFPVGRLDKDTTGLLLITDDGDFAHKVISPKSGIEKRYIATVEGKITVSDMRRFVTGITLADGTACLPARLSVLESSEVKSVAEVAIMEGKYHQIKRMFGVLEHPVLELHRISIGSLRLDKTLDFGDYRELAGNEINLALQ